MARYTIRGDCTVTATPFDSALSWVADATRPRRGKVIEFTWGPAEDATAADVIIGMEVGRITAEGINTDVVPRPVDPADAATEADAGETHTTEPTYTANEDVFKAGRHMRATYRWVAAPGGELVLPATANNGFGWRPGHASHVQDETVHAMIEEQ